MNTFHCSLPTKNKISKRAPAADVYGGREGVFIPPVSQREDQKGSEVPQAQPGCCVCDRNREQNPAPGSGLEHRAAAPTPERRKRHFGYKF